MENFKIEPQNEEGLPGGNFLRPSQEAALKVAPPTRAYLKRPDGEYYLPVAYYRETADRVFGRGGWSVNYDQSSLRFDAQSHPVTGRLIGVICTISTTLLVKDCLPVTVTGHAPVQFNRSLDTTSAAGFEAIAERQPIAVYELAIRGAEARGLKKALAHYGTAFICNPPVQTGRLSASNSSSSAPAPAPKAKEPATALRLVDEPRPVATAKSKSDGEGEKSSCPNPAAVRPTPVVVPLPMSVSKVAPDVEADVTPGAVADPWSVSSSGGKQQMVEPATTGEKEGVAVQPADEAVSEADRQAEGVEETISAEQQMTIEQLIAAKGYQMKAADTTAQKMFGAPVAKLTHSQAAQMIDKLERLKPRDQSQAA
jgi:hypothetical protein